MSLTRNNSIKCAIHFGSPLFSINGTAGTSAYEPFEIGNDLLVDIHFVSALDEGLAAVPELFVPLHNLYDQRYFT